MKGIWRRRKKKDGYMGESFETKVSGSESGGTVPFLDEDRSDDWMDTSLFFFEKRKEGDLLILVVFFSFFGILTCSITSFITCDGQESLLEKRGRRMKKDEKDFLFFFD